MMASIALYSREVRDVWQFWRVMLGVPFKFIPPSMVNHGCVSAAPYCVCII